MVYPMIRGRSEDWQAVSSREPVPIAMKLSRFASALLAGRNMHLPDRYGHTRSGSTPMTIFGELSVYRYDNGHWRTESAPSDIA
jgi:hypothetical protein